MPKNESRKILIVAAEASSCLYAERLLEHWRDTGVKIEAFGIGDEAMSRLGFECLARAEDLAVVGVQEVISHFSDIKAAFYKLLDAVRERKPQVVLLLDYPGFNLRLAKKLHGLGVPVVYYISPQVWAWRQGRVKVIKKIINKMLVVFPFEKDFYQRHGIDVEFVGHPLLDELARSLEATGRAARRAKYGIAPDDLVLALMPGSRRSELKHHLAVQLAAAKKVIERDPRIKLILPVAPNFTLEQMKTWLGDLDVPLILVKDEPFAMIDLADVVLCASGTATLMVGLMEKPMVIMYRMNPVTAFLARRFVTATKYFGLINLVLDEAAVPEVFQNEANPDHLARLLTDYLSSETAREDVRLKLRRAKERLGSRGATARVAKALEAYL